MRKPKGVTRICCLRGRCMGGRGRQNHASPLFCSCGKAVWRLTQPSLHSLLLPLKWERFPMHLHWPDLQVRRLICSGGFLLMQQPEQAGWWGCALAHNLYPEKRWISHSAQEASLNPRGLYTSLCRTNPHGWEHLAAHCLTNCNSVAYFSQWRCTNSTERNTPLPSSALSPFDQLLKM